MLLFAFTVVAVSCGSDESEPMTEVDPDSDGDGVADKDDTCPNEAGTAALDGCPDSDNDGIADKDDTCPNQAGVAALGGCPDADLDGITDSEDVCPNVAGIAERDGCPADATESSEEAGPTILKINCGGPEVTIGDITFLADQFAGGASANYLADDSVTEVENTDLDEIYLTETITSNDNNGAPFSYDIPVSNGTYTVKLHFAEIYWGVTKRDGLGDGGGDGSRVFDVEIEEMGVLYNLDVFMAAGGAAKAFTKMYDVEVTDGVLNIVFSVSVDKPKISAIEVFGEGAIDL